jgi:xylulokinase
VPAWQLGPVPVERWLADHDPVLHGRAVHAMAAWDWLTMRLTGDAARAVPTGSGHPSDTTIRAAGADPARFGRLVEWGTPVGATLADAATHLGIAAGMPVVAGGNDAWASLFGAGLADPGDAVDTGGTSGGFAVYWDRELEIPGTYRAVAAIPGLWLYGGAMNATGASVDWMVRLLGADPSRPDALLAEAEASPPGADGLVFLPYLAGERSPIWDDRARGLFVGLTLAHGRGHLLRAILEGGAFALRHVAEPLLAAGVGVTHLAVSGGTVATRAWSQVKADVTGFPVLVPEVAETAALGAAILAAIGIGAWPDARAAMRAMVRIADRLEPRSELRARYDALFDVYRDLYPATREVVHRLGRPMGG